jgi:hypothetical protein
VIAIDPASDFADDGQDPLECCGGGYRPTIVDRPSGMLLDLTFKLSGLMIPDQFAEHGSSSAFSTSESLSVSLNPSAKSVPWILRKVRTRVFPYLAVRDDADQVQAVSPVSPLVV